MKRVLSIDGGGIRGIIPALALVEIEKRTGRRISDLFDLIAGTSTGGILACGLAGTNLSAEEIAKLYTVDGPAIFSGPQWNVVGPKYVKENLSEVIPKYLDGWLSDCSPDVLVTAYDIERRRPLFFKSAKARLSKEADYLLSEVAIATASAPTYFPPALCRTVDGDIYPLIDGGVYAVNPAMCALVEAMKGGSRTAPTPISEIMLVSLGTGQNTRPYTYDDAKGWGLIGWAKRILDIMLDGSSDTVDHQCRQILGPDYFRLQCRLDKACDDMDDASAENLQLLRHQAEEMIGSNEGMLDEICRRIVGAGAG